jgi:uncharacterized membrane protein (UPF0127 family)
MTHIKTTLLAAALALLATGASAQNSAQQLRAIQLQAGMHLITAEVAATPEQRQIGLMHRPSMPANHGMLFVFEEAQPQCFWMKNTLLPLSIAFIADDGSVVNVADMKPMDETSHCSDKPVRYALEMNQGWFAKKGVKAGFKLGGAPWSR